MRWDRAAGYGDEGRKARRDEGIAPYAHPEDAEAERGVCRLTQGDNI